MDRPIIGITCHALQGEIPRSAVGQHYIDAVASAGGAPVCVPIGLPGVALHRVYQALDGLLLSGGDDIAPERFGQARHEHLGLVDEARDEYELTLAEWAMRDDFPTLGICRGVQVLAVAAGGTLYQHLPDQVPSSIAHSVREYGRDHLCHDIELEARSHLAAAVGRCTTRVNSFHHQAVWDVPEGFAVSARAEDGVIEGIESERHRFVVGVQCHPEGMWRTTAPEFANLFRAFVDAAAARSPLVQISTGL
jgi:putative glutamine amidotransferase